MTRNEEIVAYVFLAVGYAGLAAMTAGVLSLLSGLWWSQGGYVLIAGLCAFAVSVIYREKVMRGIERRRRDGYR